MIGVDEVGEQQHAYQNQEQRQAEKDVIGGGGGGICQPLKHYVNGET
jgi:hypothetical protein